jgi:hypothetical protein
MTFVSLPEADVFGVIVALEVGAILKGPDVIGKHNRF